MKAGMIRVVVLGLALAGLAQSAGANTSTMYTFDSLTLGSNLTGQDSWYSPTGTVSMYTRTDNSTPTGGGAVHYGTGYLATSSGGFANCQNYRVNDGVWGFSLAGATKVAIQVDTMYDYFVVPGYTNVARFGLVSADSSGNYSNIATMGLWNATTLSPSQTSWCLMGTTDPAMQTKAFADLNKTWADVNDPGYEGTVVPPSPYGSNGGNWQCRMVVDLTANGGEGTYSCFTRQVTSSDPSWWAGGDSTGPSPWLAIPGLQNISCNVVTNGVDPTTANGIYIRHRVRSWSFDNFMVEVTAGAGPSWHTGDANHDLIVDLQDFGLLKLNYGITTGASWEQGDFNNDGGIDLQDFGLLKAHYGHTGDASVVPVTAVPEPATMSLLALAGLALLRKRNR